MNISKVIDQLVESEELTGDFFWILPGTKEVIEVTAFGHADYVRKNPDKFKIKVSKNASSEAAMQKAILAGAVKVSVVYDTMSLAGLNIRSKAEQIHQLVKRFNVKHVSWSSEISNNDWFQMPTERFVKFLYESTPSKQDPIKKMVDRVENTFDHVKKVKTPLKIKKSNPNQCPGCNAEPYNIRNLATGEKTCKKCGLIWDNIDEAINKLVNAVNSNTGARPMLQTWHKGLKDFMPVSKEIQESVLSQPLRNPNQSPPGEHVVTVL